MGEMAEMAAITSSKTKAVAQRDGEIERIAGDASIRFLPRVRSSGNVGACAGVDGARSYFAPVCIIGLSLAMA